MTPNPTERANSLAALRLEASKLAIVVRDESPRTELVRCAACGCVEIQWESWCDANTGDQIDEAGDSKWCPSCEDSEASILTPGDDDPIDGFERQHDQESLDDGTHSKHCHGLKVSHHRRTGHDH